MLNDEGWLNELGYILYAWYTRYTKRSARVCVGSRSEPGGWPAGPSESRRATRQRTGCTDLLLCGRFKHREFKLFNTASVGYTPGGNPPPSHGTSGTSQTTTLTDVAFVASNAVVWRRTVAERQNEIKKVTGQNPSLDPDRQQEQL